MSAETPRTVPPAFVSHGAPTLFIENVSAREFLGGLGARIGRPSAIVVASAHWETPAPRVGAASRPETIHDFYGFSAELYRLEYPAKGAPELAGRVAGELRRAGFAAELDLARGLDHGVWVPLKLAFPDAATPVVPLSIQPDLGPAHHLAIGRALAGIVAEGVWVLASGSAIHNLGELDWGRHDAPPAWAREFDAWAAARIAAGDIEALLDYRRQAPHAERAHPREEHLLPLFIALGAAGRGARGQRVHESFTHGTLSMAAYLFA